jgi:YD repeat-containing protein
MLKKATTTLLAIIGLIIANAQISTQLVNPAPQSPNAASIQKFGDIPVNLYSGIPNIDVPIFTGNSNGYNLNVGLRYHAGGIKVEEIASWVGLGWALNTGGIISRSIRGIADESINGFLSSTTQIRYTQFKNNQMNIQQKYDYIKELHEGFCDAEADLFSYSFNGHSGKFYWGNNNQWVTIPRANIKISGNPTDGFTIIDESGFIHVFNTTESAMSVNTSVSNGVSTEDPNPIEVKTAWYLDEVINAATGNVSLTYEYETNAYNTKSLGTETKYQSYSGGGLCYKYPVTSTAEIWNYTNRIKKITFSDGYILFTKALSQRCDLIGDYSLETIKVYNYLGNLINENVFYYSYKGGDNNVCNALDAPNKRLYLDSLKTDLHKTHRFYYNAPNSLPSRLSKSQDFWGYYNGEPNTSLVPSYSYTVSGGSTVFVSGANRNPNAVAKTGTLNKIVYPTGGNTEFDFELNSALINGMSSFMQPITEAFGMNGDYSGNTNYYDTTFEITGGNLSGIINQKAYLGVLSTISIFGVNCALWPINEGCGNVRIQRIAPDGVYTIMLNHQNNNIFLANGTYRIIADFTSNLNYIQNQSTADYRNFSLYMTWQKKDSLYYQGDYGRIPVGGLRVKTITNDDGIGNKLYKNYSYNYPNTTVTSGFMNAIPKYEDVYREVKYTTIPNGSNFIDGCVYIRRSSSSMYPLLANQGSYVGYSFVTEEQRNQNGINNGSTVYEFTNIDEYPDSINTKFPYPPPLTFEWKRGLLKSEKKYLKSGSNNVLQYEKVNAYASINSNQSTFCNSSNGLKVGSDATITFPFMGNPVTVNEFKYFTYPISNGWINLVSDTVRQYAENTSLPLTQVTNYYYDNEANLKPTRIETINSKNELTKIISRTPLEGTAINNAMPLTTDELNTIYVMVNKNIISPTLHTQQFKSNILLSQTLATYKTSPTYNVRPEKIKTQKATYPITTEVQFNAYDAKGNLLEQQKPNDVKEVFLWGYNSQYPVAKILNTTYDIAKTYITQSVLDAPTSDADLRNHLNNLRAIQGALVTTYTYKPLVGVTSETDPNGKTLYYYYDKMNRLTMVRDKDNNVIKKVCYNYAGQVENCYECVDYTANWQNTAYTECQTNSFGVNTGVLLQQQKDMNQCSPTGGQYQMINMGINTTICPIPPYVNLTSTNTYGTTGYIAKYTPIPFLGTPGNGTPYYFNVPATTGLQALGSVPEGIYTVEIYRTSSPPYASFRGGCWKPLVTGTSAMFYNVNVTTCNSISITLEQ